MCTEYMAREYGTTFEFCLPIFKKYNIACYNWGLVAGRSQTNFNWETILYLKEKGFRVDGIGWQAHLKDIEKLALNKKSLDFLSSLIDWSHRNGLDFHITEIDYRINKENPTSLDLQRQAAAYSNIVKVLISRRNNGVVTFNTWGMIDRPGEHTNENRFLFDKSLIKFGAFQSQAMPKREGFGRAIRKQFVSIFGGRK